MVRIFLHVFGLFVACLAYLPISYAQDYPSKTIQVITGFPAGGSVDIVGRHLVQKLNEITGKPFVFENRTGAGGSIAVAAVSAAKPDGYTLLFSTPGIAINPVLSKKINYKLDDFEPIALIGDAPLVLLVNSSLPIKSINELVEYSKNKSNELRFASAGNGSTSHLAMDLIRISVGLQYLHIPYRGGGPAIIDVMSGRADVAMLPISGGNMQFVRDPRLRALGQTGSKRSPLALDIPTIEEAGINPYYSTTWYMILAPKGIPLESSRYLQNQISKALKNPDLQEKLNTAGVSIINGNPKDSIMLLQSETKKAQNMKNAGLTIE
jgi:tripartite-type tricarboxylate transporter receptor subunit TctC